MELSLFSLENLRMINDITLEYTAILDSSRSVAITDTVVTVEDFPAFHYIQGEPINPIRLA